MFWVPFAMKLGAKVSVGRYIGSSMIPTMIGNGLSAAFFLAGSYAFCYGTLPMRIERLWLRLRHKTPGSSFEDPSFARKEGVPPSMYGDDSARPEVKYRTRYGGGVPKEEQGLVIDEPNPGKAAQGPVVLPQHTRHPAGQHVAEEMV